MDRNRDQARKMHGALDLSMLLQYFRWRILFTWLLVLIENVLWALVPLFKGRTIDALTNKQLRAKDNL